MLGVGLVGVVGEPEVGQEGAMCVYKTREPERPGGPRSDSEMDRLDAGLALSPSQVST